MPDKRKPNTIWTNNDRNELYKVTQGGHFYQSHIEVMYKDGKFDSWKGGRSYTSIYQVVRNQENGFCMEGVIIQPQQRDDSHDTPVMTQADKAKESQKRSHKAMTPAQKAQKEKDRELQNLGAAVTAVNPSWRMIVSPSITQLVDQARAAFAVSQQSVEQPTEAEEFHARYTVAADMLRSMASPDATPSDETPSEETQDGSFDNLSMLPDATPSVEWSSEQTQDDECDIPSMSPNSANLVARLASVAMAPVAPGNEFSTDWTSTTGRRGGGGGGGYGDGGVYGRTDSRELDLWENHEFMQNTGMPMPDSVLAPKRRRTGEVSNENLEDFSSVELHASIFLKDISATPTVTPLLHNFMPTADAQAAVLLLEQLTPAALVAPLEFRLSGPPPQTVAQTQTVARAQARAFQLQLVPIPELGYTLSTNSTLREMSNNAIRRFGK